MEFGQSYATKHKDGTNNQGDRSRSNTKENKELTKQQHGIHRDNNEVRKID